MIGRLVNFFGDAAHAKARWRLLLATLVVVFGADFLVHREHGDFFWDFIPGWAAAYGFVSCVAIIFASKLLGHQGRIMRDEDYYD
jgi:hypothetical protein